MLTFDDLCMDTEDKMDALFTTGGELERKYSGRSLDWLIDDGEFLSELAFLSLQFVQYEAAAMVAASRMGIELTADPIRIVAAYLTSDERFLDMVCDKAHHTAAKLAEAGEAVDGAAFWKFINEFSVAA